MELRSGTSFWASQDRKQRGYEELKENISCDVLIIGGGIIGALVAYDLSKKGIDVVVVEKSQISSGSTMASTAVR